MESSFAKWNVLQAATPCFRMGVLRGRQGPDSPARALCVEILVPREYRAAV
jgi:hypothetical protein